uniref:Natural cytotoxicity triggering receptor 3 n=1 Tax=Callorhinchus milii TaxID=7868 RepID=A0A4W3GLT2_CALMI
EYSRLYLLRFAHETHSHYTLQSLPVSLSCTYTGDVGSGIGTYQWLKQSPHRVPVSNDTEGFRGRVHRKTAQEFIGTRDASIAISDVRQNDSGVYYCAIDLLEEDIGYGSGTTLTVTVPVPVTGVVSNARTLLLLLLLLLLFSGRLKALHGTHRRVRICGRNAA